MCAIPRQVLAANTHTQEKQAGALVSLRRGLLIPTYCLTALTFTAQSDVKPSLLHSHTTPPFCDTHTTQTHNHSVYIYIYYLFLEHAAISQFYRKDEWPPRIASELSPRTDRERDQTAPLLTPRGPYYPPVDLDGREGRGTHNTCIYTCTHYTCSYSHTFTGARTYKSSRAHMDPAL